MSSKQPRNDGHASERARDVPLAIDSSKVSGCITPGSNVYVPTEAVTGLPRGQAFVVGFVGEGGLRYFNATQVGVNSKRTTLQLGKEHDPAAYRPRGSV